MFVVSRNYKYLQEQNFLIYGMYFQKDDKPA